MLVQENFRKIRLERSMKDSIGAGIQHHICKGSKLGPPSRKQEEKYQCNATGLNASEFKEEL